MCKGKGRPHSSNVAHYKHPPPPNTQQDALRPILGPPGEGNLGIQWLPGGSTNYCFRVYNERRPERMSVFVKHAKGKGRWGFVWAGSTSNRCMSFEFGLCA